MTYNQSYQIQDKIRVVAGLFICPYCQESFRGLAYHTRQVHNTTGRELRLKFGLPLNYSLQSPELKELRRQQALKNKMDKQLKKAGAKTRFKQGFKQSKEMIKAISRGHKKNMRLIE